MAPPPEYDKEPKAPDKSATTISNDDSKLLHSILNDQQTNSDHRPTNSAANTEGENKQVVNLDDGQLRALLDEAMNYKCPKDLEGKSNLFKELFQEVQQDEQQDDQVSETATRGSTRSQRRAGASGLRHSAARLPQSNSLQDLVAALAAEPAPRRQRHHAPVSARATQGGSLPSGVDTSFLMSEEPTSTRGAGYLATVRCVNPPPLAERRVSASDANCPAEVELLHRRSKPVFPMTYTARATLEIGSGAVCTGRAVTTTTASNQGDSAIPFSCITTPEVVASCNTTSSTAQSSVAVDPKPRSVISSSFNGLPLSRPGYGATGTTAPDEYKKSLDENGNAVQGFSSPVSGSSQHKKPRRKKSSKNETVIKSDQIDGYKGDKDLNEVLRFIESNAEQGRGAKLGRKHKDDSDDKAGKKRSTERRKDKDKPARASSLEELSRTKLEDLTAAPEPAPKPERRSWGDDARESFYYEPPLELTDFQTVTKRRKPRRRPDEPPPRRARPPSPGPRPRRESAPPSDRSNDSNDDLDSVHSLPADTTPARAAPLPACHASYADIARTRHNIPDLIESCNFYAEGEGGPARGAEAAAGGAAGDADYPALGGARAGRGKPARPRKERAPAPVPDSPAPDVVSDRRPPVILLDSARQARELDGVTFGFDVNEQLLSAASRRPRCDLVRDALDPLPLDTPTATHTQTHDGLEESAGAVAVRVAAGCGALRYVAPPPAHSRHLHQIVDYVGSAWEDIVRCGAGKVRYFSE